MAISKGDSLPDITFKEATADGMQEVSTNEIFAGKKVVLFAVPGAFTPTCTLNHLPGFLENRDAILSKGVDDIAVVAVNDGFVMGAWAKSTGAQGKVRFLADWDSAFTRAIGMDMDLSAGTLGVRSKRYSMLVEDGKVTELNLEASPGQADVSGAATLLGQL